MKQKAQLSIEFLFAMLYLIIMASILFTISDYFVSSQERIHIANQETKIANSLSKILTASRSLETAGTYGLEYRIPRIYGFGDYSEIPCTIEVRPLYIRLTALKGDESIEKEIPFNSNFNKNLACGGRLQLP